MSEIINSINSIVVYICQILAMVVILIGILKSLIIYIKDALIGKKAFKALKESRLEIGHAFSLGLAFLIGASILKTILAPTWSDIGQLAAIIAIRTGLNFFLLRDIESLFKK